MSIATRTGDAGTTGLMYNHRVSKCDPRVEACGSVDELNAALGLVRATANDPSVKEKVLAIQNDLIILMGELATLPGDLPRFDKDGFHRVTPTLTEKLDHLVARIESKSARFKGWAMPGDSLASAALDMARATCRRAERRVCQLQEQGVVQNPELIVYLNRLSDLLWLLARWTDVPENQGSLQ